MPLFIWPINAQVKRESEQIVDSASNVEYDCVSSAQIMPKSSIASIPASWLDIRLIENRLEHIVDHAREEAAHYLTGARLLVANIAQWYAH
jgi:hypothetical protein